MWVWETRDQLEFDKFERISEWESVVNVKIKSPLESNWAIPVNIQDQHSEIVDLFMHRTLSTFTLLNDTVVWEYTFTMTPWHWLVSPDNDWETLCFLEWLNFSQFTILGIVWDIVTVDSPFDRVYTTASIYQHHTPEMNFDWSWTPLVYFIKPAPWLSYDITRILIHIEDWTAMDTAKFWGIDRLIRWCLLRKKDWVYKNLVNWKSNWEWLERAFDWRFDDKSPSWVYWFSWRKTYGGQNKVWVTIRLDWETNDELQLIIQDDLTDLLHFHVIVQGHVVTD